MNFRAILFLIGISLTSNYSKAQEFNEILGRPTDHSITLSVMFNSQVTVFIEYGLQAENLALSTVVQTTTAGVPDEIELENLLPNSTYHYRTCYRKSGNGNLIKGSIRQFRTQRAAGSIFTFTVEADVHLYDKKGCTNLYNICLDNQLADNPDFMIDLGDTFGDDHHPELMTSATSDSLHKVYRPILGRICHSVPFYFCLGNHEGEFDYYLAQTPPNNMAVWGTLWRKFYFPNPHPDGFYTGNEAAEPYGMGNPENYYSWIWGDALFVVMDVYRDQCDSSAKPKNWEWSIGLPQYTWLKNTLENSTQKYKFVFAHHTRGQGRGGVLTAKYYEWGGYEGNGTNWGFDTNRPGWEKPIHQLFVDNGVNIFFQGHDHLYSREILDNVIYQEVPMPSDSTYEIGMLANADAYVSDTIDGSGHLRVTVGPSCVRVDYIRAYLPADTLSGSHHNRENAFSYVIGECPPSANEEYSRAMDIEVYPNPVHDLINIRLPNTTTKVEYCLLNTLGQIVLRSESSPLPTNHLSPGIYLLTVTSEQFKSARKILIE